MYNSVDEPFLTDETPYPTAISYVTIYFRRPAFVGIASRVFAEILDDWINFENGCHVRKWIFVNIWKMGVFNKWFAVVAFLLQSDSKIAEAEDRGKWWNKWTSNWASAVQCVHESIYQRLAIGSLIALKPFLSIPGFPSAYFYGLPGGHVTITCPRITHSQIQGSDWFIVSKCDVDGMECIKIITVLEAVSSKRHIKRSDHVQASRWSVTPRTGSLTLQSFTTDDEGIYLCQWLGDTATEIQILPYS